MLQVQQQISEYKNSIESSFRESVKHIKTLYCRRIQKLEGIISVKDSRIAVVEKELKAANIELAIVKEQNLQLQQIAQKYKEQIEHLNTFVEQLTKSTDDQLFDKQSRIKQLQQKVQEQKIQIQKLNNQQEKFSTTYSSISRQQSHSFSVQISQLFKNSPHEILKFLDSIEGQHTQDPKEVGDMTCMFVSRDGLSMQKFVKINRTFLKRTIKEHQKRFRFVLIHKPDKQ